MRHPGQRPPSPTKLQGGHIRMTGRPPARPSVRTTWRPTAVGRAASCFQPVLHRSWMGLKHEQAVLRELRLVMQVESP